MSSNIIEVGSIINDLHYGPFASFWWYEKSDSSTKTKKFYPIRLNLITQHTIKDTMMYCYIKKNNQNQPEFICSIKEFISSAKDMSSAVNETYQKYLSSIESLTKARLSGPNFFGMLNEEELHKISVDIKFFPFIIEKDKIKMFVINASSDNKIDPSDGYHIIFKEKYKQQTSIFSQYYENKKFFINIYSYNTSQLLNKYEHEDVNEVWKLTGLFKKYSGNELFLLNHDNIKKIFKESSSKIVIKRCDWNQKNFEQLHLDYMLHICKKELTISVLNYLKSKKATLFELYNLLQKYQIIEKTNLNNNETVNRTIRAWRKLLIASGCKELKNNNNKEVS
jgi:hypothetical protein